MDAVVGGLLAVVGSAFMLVAGIGVLRFPDVSSRIHAATKVPTLGFVLVALGAMVVVDRGRGQLGLAVTLIFVTAPVAAHLIGRAAQGSDEIEAWRAELGAPRCGGPR